MWETHSQLQRDVKLPVWSRLVVVHCVLVCVCVCLFFFFTKKTKKLNWAAGRPQASADFNRNVMGSRSKGTNAAFNLQAGWRRVVVTKPLRGHKCCSFDLLLHLYNSSSSSSSSTLPPGFPLYLYLVKHFQIIYIYKYNLMQFVLGL